MAVNVISDQKKDPQKKVKVGNSRVLGWLSQWFNIERLTGEKQFPIKYIDGSLFLLVLGLITVFFRINAERQMRQLRRANEEVNNLRAGYTILNPLSEPLGNIPICRFCLESAQRKIYGHPANLLHPACKSQLWINRKRQYYTGPVCYTVHLRLVGCIRNHYFPRCYS